MAIAKIPHFRIAWKAFQAQGRVLVLSLLVLFASWVALELCVVALDRLGPVPNLLLHLAFLWLLAGLMVGVHRMAIEILGGGAPPLRRMTASLAQGSSYLLAFGLYLALVVAGLLLLAVPGIYVGVRYGLFGQVLATKRTSAGDALREAGSLSRGRWWAVCRVLALALALNLAGAALLGVGLMISLPVSLLAVSSLFVSLSPRTPAWEGSGPSGHPAARPRLVREAGPAVNRI